MPFTPNGIYTAIVTPFTDEDEFDATAFRKLIEFQISAGAAGLLVIGGSGEFVSLTPSERQRIIDVCVEQTVNRIPIIVGALAPGTREVQDTVRYAAKAGADAVLVLPSYYIKASADGIVEHFKRVAGVCDVPIVAYNNVSRTGLELTAAVLERLALIPSIVALKECERDLAIVAHKILTIGDRIAIMSGDDDLGFPTFLLGSPGGIFTTANLVPALHRQLFDASVRGDIAAAKALHYALLPLVEAVYTADHPGPLKDALAFAGHPVGRARAPLQRGRKENMDRAAAALKAIEALGIG